jgi:hypothetical protein
VDVSIFTANVKIFQAEIFQNLEVCDSTMEWYKNTKCHQSDALLQRPSSLQIGPGYGAKLESWAVRLSGQRSGGRGEIWSQCSSLIAGLPNEKISYRISRLLIKYHSLKQARQPTDVFTWIYIEYLLFMCLYVNLSSRQSVSTSVHPSDCFPLLSVRPSVSLSLPMNIRK